jgi:hypothetical protein
VYTNLFSYSTPTVIRSYLLRKPPINLLAVGITPRQPFVPRLRKSKISLALRQFSFQLPLWQEMRREAVRGSRSKRFRLSAGSPTTENAAER